MISTLVTRRAVLAAALVSVSALARAAEAKADRIIVLKSQRRMLLCREGAIIASYAIRLGENPVGPKVFQGDGRTPEGEYAIDWRTRATVFHLALHISYPQPQNRARAAKYGLPAGGGIFIHGTPGTGRRFDRDWTDGCIAVSNVAIEEIWRAVDNGTPIEIRP